MKKLFLLTLTLFFTIGLFAQGPFTGFFKPSSELKSVITFKAEGDTDWGFHFRPAAEMNCIQFNYNKEEGLFNASTFNGAGLGLSLQHYVEKANGDLVNNYGFSALIMLDASQNTNGGLGAALTANILQFVNGGVGYMFTGDNKHLFIVTGCLWTF